MSERDTFLRAIGESWDDPTPVLVFADWAEEHGTDNPALLRWYGWHVMRYVIHPEASDPKRNAITLYRVTPAGVVEPRQPNCPDHATLFSREEVPHAQGL